ncbi:hypothetical protein [Kribbella sp.]|uniref:hypothetical protein n=1 Tax=Kribbella sp. TaxID=1871183 RepID=UPI0039C93F72
MSTRQPSFARTQSRRYSCQSSGSPSVGHASISARYNASVSGSRTNPRNSSSSNDASASASSAGSYDEPSRLHATRSAFGATYAVWSSCTAFSPRTTSNRSAGRSRVSSCARTANRRASRFDSW